MPDALSPAAAFAVLAALAALVAALYLLRPPPQRLRVSSAVLWLRVLGARHDARRRLRWWASVLLAAAIALGIAQAVLPLAPSAGPGDAAERIVVVDNSVSMNARRSDGRTRFEHALDVARAEIRRAGPGVRILVADTMRTVVSGTFLDARDAEAVLDGMRPAAGGAPSFPDLAAYPRAIRPREVVFVGDGVAPLAVPPGVRTVSVFEPVPNTGITAFSVRAWPADRSRHDALVEVGNAGTSPARVSVTLSGSGRDAITRALSVPARGFAHATFPVSDFGGGALQARVEADADALEADNTAFAFLPFNRRLRVALVTRGDAALERALRLDPRVRLTVLSPSAYAARGGFDLYVFDRFAPARAPLAPALLFHPGAAAWLPASAGERAGPVATSRLDPHPVLDNVSLSDIEIRQAQVFRTKDDGTRWALARTADQAALIVASETAPRWLAVGFAVGESSLAAQASFPVLLGNALGWLTDELVPQAEPVGPVRVALPEARAAGTMAGPLDVRHVPGGTLFTVPAPDFVTVDGSGRRLRVLANLLDPALTDVNASSWPVGTPLETATNARVPAAGPPVWWLLLAAAGALLLLEWIAYHRRVTV